MKYSHKTYIRQEAALINYLNLLTYADVIIKKKMRNYDHTN